METHPIWRRVFFDGARLMATRPARRHMDLTATAAQSRDEDFHLCWCYPEGVTNETGIVNRLAHDDAAFNETNPFAIKFQGPKNGRSTFVAHQPKSFDWRAREPKLPLEACLG